MSQPFSFAEIPMDILARYPQHMNPLLPTYYRFTIARLPFVTYFCQSASIPNVTVTEVMIPTPFMAIKRPSKMDFDDLNITFVVDENLGNWLEIFKWMRSTVPVDGFAEIKPANTHTSTANILILNSAKQPKLNVTFTDVFPKTLSSLDFSSAMVDPEPFVASVTFSFRSYDIEIL